MIPHLSEASLPQRHTSPNRLKDRDQILVKEVAFIFCRISDQGLKKGNISVPEMCTGLRRQDGLSYPWALQYVIGKNDGVLKDGHGKWQGFL